MNLKELEFTHEQISWKGRLTPYAGGISRTALIASDLLMIMLAFVMAHSAYMFIKIGRVVVLDHNPFVAVASLSLLGVFLFWNRGHYTRRILFWDELYSILKVVGFLALINIILVILINNSLFSSLRWAATWSYALICIIAGRMLLKSILARCGLWACTAFIVGAGQNAQNTYQALSRDRMLGYKIVAFIDPEQSTQTLRFIEMQEERLPVLSGIAQHCKLINRLKGEVFIALDAPRQEQIGAIAKALRPLKERLHVMTPLWGLPLAGMEVTTMFSNDLFFMSLKNNLGLRHMRALKRSFDLVCAGLLLMLLSPLFLVLALRVKLDSPGPVFYGHKRVGRNGLSFKCYKFRTMVMNSDEVLKEVLARDPEARREWEKDFKLKDDPRITRIGKFLRDYSLDELPQLWSVLIGDMSLVGPRPIVEAELERYQEDVDYYLEVRPGLTGVWQVSGRNDVAYDQRVAYDVWYVKNWMLWYDIAILFKTVGAVINKKGAY